MSQTKKRAAESEGSSDEDSALEQILEATRSELLKATGEMLDTKLRATTSELKKYFNEKNKKIESDVAGNSKDIAELQVSQASMQMQQAEMWRSIRSMQETLAVSEDAIKSTRDPPQKRVKGLDEFDQTVIRCSSEFKKNIPFSAIEELIKSLAHRANIKDEWYTIRGSKFTNFWTICFLGDDTAKAGRRARKFNDCMFVDGKWEEQFVVQPGGKRHKIFISPDKPKFKILLEQGFSLIKSILSQELAEEELDFVKRDMLVCRGWDEIAALEFDWALAKPRLVWKAFPADITLDTTKATALFEEAWAKKSKEADERKKKWG